MNKLIIFNESEEGIRPIAIKGEVFEHAIQIGDTTIPCNSNLRDFLFGDVLFACISETRGIEPIRRTEQFAVRNPLILNQIESVKGGLKNLVENLKTSLESFNEQIRSGHGIDYNSILSRIKQIEQAGLQAEISKMISTTKAVRVVVSTQKYTRPEIWDISIEKKKLEAFVDSGSQISIIDSNLDLHDPKDRKSVTIEGITGIPETLPYVRLGFTCKGKKAEAFFAIMPGLEMKVGKKVLIGQDIYNYIRGK